MHLKKFANVLALAPQERYRYFVRVIADREIVWGLQLVVDKWVISESAGGRTLYPFWPEREFAEAVATDEWEKAKAGSIPLDDFMDVWLPGMHRDGVVSNRS